MNQHLQQHYLEFQSYHERLQHLHAQHETLENHLQELQAVATSLEQLQNLGQQKDILVPISNSIFAKASIHPPKQLLVGVGSNILVEKSPEEAAASIQQQISELSTILQHLEQELLTTTQRLQHLQREIEKEKPKRI